MIDYPIERQLEFVCLERDALEARVAALTTALAQIASGYARPDGSRLLERGPMMALATRTLAALDAARGA